MRNRDRGEQSRARVTDAETEELPLEENRDRGPQTAPAAPKEVDPPLFSHEGIVDGVSNSNIQGVDSEIPEVSLDDPYILYSTSSLSLDPCFVLSCQSFVKDSIFEHARVGVEFFYALPHDSDNSTRGFAFFAKYFEKSHK